MEAWQGGAGRRGGRVRDGYYANGNNYPPCLSWHYALHCHSNFTAAVLDKKAQKLSFCIFCYFHKLQVEGYKLQVTSGRLQVTSYKWKVTSYKLKVEGYKLKVTNGTSNKLQVAHGTSNNLQVTNGTSYKLQLRNGTFLTWLLLFHLKLLYFFLYKYRKYIKLLTIQKLYLSDSKHAVIN